MSDHAQGSPQGFDREISVRAIVISVVGLLIVIVLSMVAMAWLDSWIRAQQEPAQLSPLEEATEPRLPPGPQLQADPEGDLIRMRAEEARILDGFAWTDSTESRARIPLDRAIDLVAEHGLETVEGWLAEGDAGDATAGDGGEAPDAAAEQREEEP